MKMSKDNMRVRNEVNEKSEKKRKLDCELKVETGTRPKIRVRNVSPGISKIASIFEKGDQASVEKKKYISNVLVKRNAIEKMMSDIKTRRVEKIKMKPNNKKCIKVTKNEAKVKNEGERKSMSEALEKWIRKEKIENDSCEKTGIWSVKKVEKREEKRLSKHEYSAESKVSERHREMKGINVKLIEEKCQIKNQKIVQKELGFREKVRNWDHFFDKQWAVMKNSEQSNLKGQGGLKNEKGGGKVTQPETKPNTTEEEIQFKIFMVKKTPGGKRASNS